MLAENERDRESEIIEVCGHKVLVDRVDVERIRGANWSLFRNRGTLVFQTRVRENGKLVRMNLPRFLVRPDKGFYVVDKETRKEWDYRKSAFLVCDAATRAARLGKRKHQTTSRFKGVSYSTKLGLWTASIRPAGQSIHLGSFTTEIAAALAYNEAALKYFGPIAYLNDVESSTP